MTSPLNRPPKREPSPIWPCLPDALQCRYGHDFVRMRDTAMQLRYRAAGHVYLDCPQCTHLPERHSYAFGVLVTQPSPMVTFYAVPSRAVYDSLLELPDELPTWDVLALLGYTMDRRSSSSR